jgi:hypothetical protein
VIDHEVRHMAKIYTSGAVMCAFEAGLEPLEARKGRGTEMSLLQRVKSFLV